MGKRKRLPTDKRRRGLAIGLGAALLALLLVRVLALERAEAVSFDLRLRWRPGNQLSADKVRVLVVAIDPKTNESDRDSKYYKCWPFPRDYYIDALDVLREAGARCVGFDIRFEEPHPDEDAQLAAGLKRAGDAFLGVRFDPVTAYFTEGNDVGSALDPALLGTLPKPPPGSLLMKRADLPPPELLQSARAAGSLTIIPELDGVVRRFPLVVPYVRPNDPSGRVRLYASLPLLMAARMLNVPLSKVRVRLGDAIEIGDRRIPINASGEMVINYYGGFGALYSLSYLDVARRVYDPEYFHDKAVLIGNTLSGGFDIQVTPYPGQYPGVEAQATVLQNILEGSAISTFSPWVGLVMLVGFALFIGATRPCRLSTQFACAAGSALLVLLAGYLLLAVNSLWMEVVRPLMGIGLAYLLVSFDTFREAQAAQARVEGAVQILAELTTAMSGTKSATELCGALEDSATRVLHAGQARLEIRDDEMRQYLSLEAPAAGSADTSAAWPPSTVAPLAARGREIGSLAVHQMEEGAHPALVQALTLFLGVILENAALSGEVRSNALNLTVTLAEIIESKDRYTAGHCTRVMTYAERIAERMGLPDADLEQLRYGALLHDVGKVAIPEGVLNKPGRLDESEMTAMRQHPVLGDQWLHHQTRLRTVREMVASHHEWYDGRGYPRGLAGEAIPVGGRILAVADVWDALTSDRPYRKAMRAEEARQFIEGGRGTQFDPAVVDAFLAYLDSSED